MATPPGTKPFEQEFPTVFAATLKALVEDLALPTLLTQLGMSLSAQIAPASIHIERDGSDDAASNTTTATAGQRDHAPAEHWRVRLDDPTSTVTQAQLDAVGEFVNWLTDRHAARRRRLAAVNHERQVIAGQLHDDPIQAMTAVSLHLQRLVRTGTVEREQVERLLNLTNGAIDRLRHAMFALHPPSLAADGLVITLEDYLVGFIAPTGLAVAVTGDVDCRAAPEIESLAFRLARSAIRNSWQHAQARVLDVDVAFDTNSVHITVHDDGIGFDVERAHHPDAGHAGLEYARDLAAEVGGHYVVTSTPGIGTTVRIDLPRR